MQYYYNHTTLAIYPSIPLTVCIVSSVTPLHTNSEVRDVLDLLIQNLSVTHLNSKNENQREVKDNKGKRHKRERDRQRRFKT